MIPKRLTSWKNADSPTPSSLPHKNVPLLTNKTFIFIALSLAPGKIMSRGDEEEEGGKDDAENILQKLLFILKFSSPLISFISKETTSILRRDAPSFN